MEVTFNLTTRDVYKYRLYLLTHDFGYLASHLAPLPVLVFFLASLLHQDYLFNLFLALILTPLFFGLNVINLRNEIRKEVLASPELVGQRTVTLGKYDLHWASPKKHYFFHWTNFSALVDWNDYFYLLLPKRRVLMIPKDAFNDSAQAQQFLMIALDRWQRAKAGEAGLTGQDAWPPPPQIGA